MLFRTGHHAKKKRQIWRFFSKPRVLFTDHIDHGFAFKITSVKRFVFY